MIAIPNMEKPKKCNECPYKACIWGMHFIEALNYISEIKERDEPPDDCPLIEIVWCKDCKHLGKTDADWFCNGGFEIDCGDPYVGGQTIVHPLNFCSYGERREE